MIRKFKFSYSGQPERKEKVDFINKIFAVRERLFEIDNLVFKGIDFEEDPLIVNLSVSYFY